MRTYKKTLPKGVRKKFITKIGRKIRIVNKLYCKKTTKKENSNE
jgi:hypothetical protein